MFKETIFFQNVSIYVRPVVVSKEQIYFVNRDHQLMSIKIGEILLLNEGKFSGLNKVFDKIYCFDESKMKTLVLDIGTSTGIYWKFTADPLTQSFADVQKHILSFVNINNDIFLALVDTQNGEIVKKIDINGQLKNITISDEKIFAIVNDQTDSLQCLSSKNELNWKKNLHEVHGPSDTRQMGNLVFNNGKLYLVLESPLERKKATYVVDGETGKVLSQFDDLAGSYHIAEGIVFKAYRYSVDRIDTRTNTLISDNFEDILKPEKLWIHDDTSILTKDELLYFYDGATIGGNRIGVLDLKKHQLLWQTKLKIKSTYKSIRSMQLHDDILYVHADDDTLHIFEKK